jgi:hypothetical protein
MTNTITKENLTTLGNLLRDSKKIKKLVIIGLTVKNFGDNKKDFCNEILNLLKKGETLQIKVLQNEGYFGMTNPNVKDFLNSQILEEIQIAVISK